MKAFLLSVGSWEEDRHLKVILSNPTDSLESIAVQLGVTLQETPKSDGRLNPRAQVSIPPEVLKAWGLVDPYKIDEDGIEDEGHFYLEEVPIAPMQGFVGE